MILLSEWLLRVEKVVWMGLIGSVHGAAGKNN